MPALVSCPTVGRRRRRAVRVTLLLAVGLVGALLAGCASGSSSAGPASGDTTEAPRPPSVAVDPPAGAVEVSPLAPVKVTVTDGKLGQVTMTSPEGTPAVSYTHLTLPTTPYV